MNFWKKIPLAKVAIFFLSGLFFSIELNFQLGVASPILSISLFSIIILLRVQKPNLFKLRVQAILWMALFMILGIWRGEYHRKNIQDNWLKPAEIESSEAFILSLNSEVSEKTNSYKCEAEITGIFRNDSLIEHHEKTLCYFPKSVDLALLDSSGVIISLRKPTIISPPRNPKEFNYKKYLSGLGVQTQFYLDSSSFTVTSKKQNTGFLTYFSMLKKRALTSLKNIGVHGEAYGVIAALVLGEKDFLDADTYRSYGAAGATHVLAVSGLHVGLIYLILIKLCSPFKKRRFGRLLTVILGLLGLWLYAGVTGFSPSVLRASTMFSAILIGQQMKRSSSIYNTLAASAIALLFITPNLLMEVGFQLSYSAVIGILLIQPWLYRLWIPRFWLLDKAWQLSTVSIAAQLGTFPLGMLYFHQFPNYFLLSNLFVIPAATFILYLTLAALALSFTGALAEFLGSILQGSVELLNRVIKKVQELPYAISEGIDISILECFILYFIIFTGMSVVINRNYRTLKYTSVLCLFFLALQCQEKYNQSNQSFIMVHSLRNERAISVVEGTNVTLLSSEKFIGDKEKIKFHLSHFWNSAGITSIEKLKLDDLSLATGSIRVESGILFYNDIALRLADSKLDAFNPEYSIVNKMSDESEISDSLIIDGKSRLYFKLDPELSSLNARKFAVLLD